MAKELRKRSFEDHTNDPNPAKVLPKRQKAAAARPPQPAVSKKALSLAHQTAQPAKAK